MRICQFLLVAALLVGCAKQTHEPTAMLDDPRWKALSAEMMLSEQHTKRLELFITTLESSRTMLRQAAPNSRDVALTRLDTEIHSTLPVLVAPQHVERVEHFLRTAMRDQ